MKGSEERDRLAARLMELLLAYEAAIATRDRAIVAASTATHALDAADEEVIEIETQLARHVDEMKASARLRVRLEQKGKP